MAMVIEGPAPGFLGFVRWLFEPIRPPMPPSPPSASEAREILSAMAELEARRRSTPTTPLSLSSNESADAAKGETEVKALLEVLDALRKELGMSLKDALVWVDSQPLSSFGGETAIALIEQGRGAAVLYYIRSISNGHQG